MNLADAILAVMLKAVPPGRGGFTLTRQAYSVELVPTDLCAPEAAECAGARHSKFYGTWVRQESAETGRARYQKMAGRLALLLAESSSPALEAGRVIGVSVNESGLREDVEFGRGRSGRVKPTQAQYDDAGGEGRGPGNEACVMQILPSMAQKFGGPEALLGDSDGAIDRCFSAGLEQLRHGEQMCRSVAKRQVRLPDGSHVTKSLTYAMVSYFGTGSSCTSSNLGKSEARVQTITWVTVELRRLLSAP